MDYPYLLLSLEKCENNILRMIKKARENKINLRPHFKTHQNQSIANIFRVNGINSCAVSSLKMAEYFSKDNWNDITVAFPSSPFDAEKINKLGSSINLNILFSSFSNLKSLDGLINQNVGVYIELDFGYQRSGVNADNLREIAVMINYVEQNRFYSFKGFLIHSGNTYHAKSQEEVEAIHRNTLSRITKVKSFWKESYPEITVTYGDTPSCSISNDFWGINELRPGNFVFYDITQANIGSCSIKDIAVALICPVVDVYPERGEAIIKGGAIHLSKDYLQIDDQTKSYGLPCSFNGKTWEDPYKGLYLKSLSQEHGIIGSKEIDQITQIKTGDLIAVLPVHSCLTVDTMGEYYLADGNRFPTMRKRQDL